MIKFVSILMILLSFSSLCQNDQELDDYLIKIDNSVFTDTIHLTDSIFGQKAELLAFSINDTILKVKLLFVDLKRTRDIYYIGTSHKRTRVCFIREYDNDTNLEFIKIKTWNNSILESRISEPINQDERNDPNLILKRSDFIIKLELFKIDQKAEKFSFIGKLVEKAPLPGTCGVIAWATAFKFEIIESDFPTDQKFFIIIITCPRAYGEDFYEPTRKYNGILATNSGSTFSWALQNNYANEDLPTFWAREIDQTK